MWLNFIGIAKNVTPINNIEESSNSSSIRRACSLSDLHMGNMVKGKCFPLFFKYTEMFQTK